MRLGWRRWFFFRVTGARDEQLHLNIVNAGEGSFPTVPLILLMTRCETCLASK